MTSLLASLSTDMNLGFWYEIHVWNTTNDRLRNSLSSEVRHRLSCVMYSKRAGMRLTGFSVPLLPKPQTLLALSFDAFSSKESAIKKILCFIFEGKI